MIYAIVFYHLKQVKISSNWSNSQRRLVLLIWCDPFKCSSLEHCKYYQIYQGFFYGFVGVPDGKIFSVKISKASTVRFEPRTLAKSLTFFHLWLYLTQFIKLKCFMMVTIHYKLWTWFLVNGLSWYHLLNSDILGAKCKMTINQRSNCRVTFKTAEAYR